MIEKCESLGDAATTNAAAIKAASALAADPQTPLGLRGDAPSSIMRPGIHAAADGPESTAADELTGTTGDLAGSWLREAELAWVGSSFRDPA